MLYILCPEAVENTIIEIIWADLELFDIQSNKYVYYPEIILLEELEKISDEDLSKIIEENMDTEKNRKLINRVIKEI